MTYLGHVDTSPFATALAAVQWGGIQGRTHQPARRVSSTADDASLLRLIRKLALDVLRPYRVTYARYSKLPPGAWVPWHADTGHVVHLALTTNPLAYVYVQHTTWHFGVGECWEFDASKPHSAGNWGATERVHVILDVAGWPNS